MPACWKRCGVLVGGSAVFFSTSIMNAVFALLMLPLLSITDCPESQVILVCLTVCATSSIVSLTIGVAIRRGENK